jgi:hypothetical protein
MIIKIKRRIWKRSAASSWRGPPRWLSDGQEAPKKCPATDRQAGLTARIVVRRNGVEDLVGAKLARVRRSLDGFILSLGKIVGSTRVHD